MKTLTERFWAKVERKGEGADECWIWTGAMNGAPCIRDNKGANGKIIRACAVAWELQYGYPAHRMAVFLRQCREVRCVNPSHMILTYSIAECSALARRMWPVTRKLTIDNLYTARRLHDAGLTYAEVGSQLGVSAMTAWQAVNRDTRIAHPGTSGELEGGPANAHQTVGPPGPSRGDA